MSGGGIELLSSGGGGGASGGTIPFNVPNCAVWDALGDTIPFQRASIFRVGTRLYGFGAYIGGNATAKIYSAQYPVDDTTPVWTDTGATLPGAIDLARVGLLAGATPTLYIFGSDNNSNAIYSAPLSTPTVWTDTGHNMGGSINNAPIVIDGGQIMIIKGSSAGSPLNTVRKTSVSTPTTGWTDVAFGGSAALACGAYVSSTCLYEFDGTSVNFAPVASLGGSASVTNGIPTQQVDSPAIFHLGHELIVLGGNNDRTVLRGNPSNPTAGWQVLPNALPGSVYFSYYNAWIGGDGRAYVINLSSSTTYRSRRQVVNVPKSSIDPSAPYAPLLGTLSDGSPGVVSPHVRMGVAPWQTNMVSLF